ncbi:hypothetical protein BU25DRAFT_174883 [Macroventuria anomochaeta]|uniref:Uncharacterized protein n=1 Tax=Macroventuria anomochaeta TaxID=301207 RepID=A0ACB6RNM6_9PLEO|nr:uncharacterized protein BU25DRAFT_174883 [Macroventuria anomochaeta]KAF2623491.1 hypothetical protein BU25DRAFT_174883 [Macroventuria anomochaeta]
MMLRSAAAGMVAVIASLLQSADCSSARILASGPCSSSKIPALSLDKSMSGIYNFQMRSTRSTRTNAHVCISQNLVRFASPCAAHVRAIHQTQPSTRLPRHRSVQVRRMFQAKAV